MNKKVDFWFDFSNPPHVNLFLPIKKHFENQGFKSIATARSFVETTGLLDKYNVEYKSFGKHGGKNRLSKTKNLLLRNFLLYRNIPDFKLSISSSFEAPQISWLKNRPSVIFDDNETAPNWLYSKFVSYVFSPDVIEIKNWTKNGINPKKVIPYPGFKEDIYIADYVPDPNFLSQLPFKKFVTVRPENIFAAYVPKNTKSITPDLIKKLSERGYNILYLPRYEIDKSYYSKQENIFVPDKPLNGLDVCYYSDAVLTGAGTFAREAAIIGTPAISFFAGSQLLTVDQKMIENELMFFSRRVDEIMEYLDSLNLKLVKTDFSSSKTVKNFVVNSLMEIINKQ